mgnify:CR=1 FL=1
MQSEKLAQLDEHAASEVAVVGFAGRFAGARNTDEFWRNLRDGVESISFFTKEELLASGVESDQIDAPEYVPAKATLADVELFDAAFFDFSPREAEMLDPQHRVLLECAVEAFEHAGYYPESVKGRVGVYAGVSAGSSRMGPVAEMRALVTRLDRAPGQHGDGRTGALLGMSAEDFTNFGWRIPFILSIILVALALYIRLRLQETPLFSELKAAGKSSTSPWRSWTSSTASASSSGPRSGTGPVTTTARPTSSS